jgi:heme ABC exporter ATP-binding subunit CcmA
LTVPAVALRDLEKLYGPVPALDRLSLDIAPGEFVLLAGPNGAGKSTLLKTLALLVRPNAGMLRLFGEDARRGDRTDLRRRIGLLSHQSFLYDHLTGLENLEFFGRLYGLADPRRTAHAAIRSVGLEGRADDAVGGYSRGMQQRLAIARAFLHRPDLLLLDEPFTGLDADGADRLESHLRQVRDEGRTCVLATHDLPAALRLAGRVLVLADGGILADRPAAGLRAADLETLVRTAARPGPPRAGAGRVDPGGRA